MMKHTAYIALSMVCISSYVGVYAATDAAKINFLKKISIASIDSRATTTFTTKGALGDASKQQIQVKPGNNSFPYNYKPRTQNPLTLFSWIDQATLQQPIQKIQLETQYKKNDGTLGGPWNIVMTLLQKEDQLVIIVDSIAFGKILSTQMVNLSPMIRVRDASLGGAIKSGTTGKSASELFLETYVLPAAQKKDQADNGWILGYGYNPDQIFQVRLHGSINQLAVQDFSGAVQIDSIDIVYINPSYKSQGSGVMYKDGKRVVSPSETYTLSVRIDDLMQKIPGIVSPLLKPEGIDTYISSQL